MVEMIKVKNGELIEGQMVRVYGAFEGGMRYIFRTTRGEYRCVKDADGNYVEYTP